MKKELIWVHPTFKKKLKIKAIEEETTVIGLTKRMAGDDNCLKYYEELKKKNGFKIPKI